MFRKQAKRLLSYASANNYHTLNSIELSKDNVLHNVALMQKQHPGFGIIPVLKANAYGHGLKEIASILNQANCRFVAVDGYFEAAKIRDLTKHPILVLGYIKPENAGMLDIEKCSFVIQDVETLMALGRLNKPVRTHIELNTGMNRLGLSEDELEVYLKALKQFPLLQLEGVMTHLADADNEVDDSFTLSQVRLFDRLLQKIQDQGINPKYVHVAQTAGSLKAKSKFANCIRLGIGLYGINPLGRKDKSYKELSRLKPVLSLKSTVIKIVTLQKGDRVSYNGIFTAPKKMKIGVLPVGYYEGLPRELSNKGVVTFGNYQLPIVGRICMNHTMIDLNSRDVKVGDEVTVISNKVSNPNSVQQISEQHQVFSYVLATKLSSSVRRIIT